MDDDKEYRWQYKDLGKRIKEILKDYRANVDYFYSDLYDSNPDYFPIYKSAKVLYLPFKNDPSTSGVAFYCGAGSNGDDEIEEINIPQRFIETHTNRSSQDLIRIIAEKAGINIHDLYKAPVLMPKLGQLSYENDKGMGYSFASGDAKEWNDDAERFISYAYPKKNLKLPSSISKYHTLIDAINDKELSFEIEEAFNCFKHEEYLACALVLGRALEYTCKLLLDQADSKIYASIPTANRTLNTLANKLESENLIDSFEHNALKAAILYRNSIAHATPVTKIKNVIQQIFAGIKLLAQKIKDIRNN